MATVDRNSAGGPFFVEFDLADPSALDLEWNFTDRADRLYRTAHRLLSRGFFGEAAALFDRATRYDRAHYAAYVGLTEALIMQGKLDEAARVADQSLERYGRNCELGAARGHIFLHQDDFHHASECVDIAIQNAPETAYVWIVAGELRLTVHEALPYAMDCFAHARDAADGWPHLNLRIALAFLEWGHATHAARSLEAILKVEPDLPLAWILLGDAHRTLGEHAAARECYRRAADLVPDLESVHRALGWGGRLMNGWRKLRQGARDFLAPA